MRTKILILSLCILLLAPAFTIGHMDVKYAMHGEKKMATFGVTALAPPREDGYPTTYSFGDNNYWGIAYANLVYCPDYGWANSITAYVRGDAGGKAIAGLLRVDTPPPDAPYWEEYTTGLNATLIAKGTLQNVSATAGWQTWAFPRVSISPGYYLLALYAEEVYVYGNIQWDEHMIEDLTKNQLGLNNDPLIRPPSYIWPDNLTYFSPDGTWPTDYPLQMAIYCRYQKYVIGISLRNLAIYSRVK